jgi:hypothetical protein
MSKMGLFWTLFILALECKTALGQDSLSNTQTNKLTYGLQLGISLSHFAGHNTNGDRFGNENLVRLRGGGNLNIPFHSVMAFRPELLISMGGFRTNDSLKTNLTYLKIPANLVIDILRLSSGYGIKDLLKLGFGPYLAYALGGRMTDNHSITPIKFSNGEISSASPNYNAYFKRWDTGINTFLEFAGNNFYSQLGTSIGLLNIKPHLENPSMRQATCRNTSFNLSYGWRF